MDVNGKIKAQAAMEGGRLHVCLRGQKSQHKQHNDSTASTMDVKTSAKQKLVTKNSTQLQQLMFRDVCIFASVTEQQTRVHWQDAAVPAVHGDEL